MTPWSVIPVLALLAVAAGLSAYFARNVLGGAPHVFDGISLVFQAKIFLSAQLSAPAPFDARIFDVPLMVVRNGRWFSQYPPGAALALAPFVAAGAGWLAAPVFAAVALWPVFLTGRRLYGYSTALLALLLGALSPFLVLMSASFLSHPVALLLLAWAFYAFVRFDQGRHTGWLVAGWLFLDAALLTRETAAVLFAAPLLLGVYLGRRRGSPWGRKPALWLSLGLVLVGVAGYLAYNAFQTGTPLLTPRLAFDRGDRPGFGDGIGFYGRHTFAAGLVNTEQNLTSLAITLFGWPFPFALAVPLLPFLTGRARVWDWVCLAIVVAFIGGYVLYFYHGIVFGPRYYYEAMPALLVLAARGFAVSGELATAAARRLGRGAPRLVWTGPALALSALMACNLLFYLPRQSQLYRDYSGIPAGEAPDYESAPRGSDPLDLTALASLPDHALILTGDRWLYLEALAVRNCPSLDCAQVFALVTQPDQERALRQYYADRIWLEATRKAGGIEIKAIRN